MNLSCKTMLLATLASALACSDVTAPPADYMLIAVNGKALPTSWSPIPEAPTILSGTLHLDGRRTATLTERRVELGTAATITSTYTYKITGNQILFSFYCPPNAGCIRPPAGTIDGLHISIDMSGGSRAIIYDFTQGSTIE